MPTALSKESRPIVWFLDWLEESQVFGIGLAALFLLWIPYLIIRKSRRSPGAMVALVGDALRFRGSVRDRTVETRRLRPPSSTASGRCTNRATRKRHSVNLARSEAGIGDGSRVFEVDKSRETTMDLERRTLPASSGSKRIVDLGHPAPPSLMTGKFSFVVGHEIGHYVLNHVDFRITGLLHFSSLDRPCHRPVRSRRGSAESADRKEAMGSSKGSPTWPLCRS